MALLGTFGRPVDTDPVSAVIGEIQFAAGHVQWLRERVQATDPADIADSAAPLVTLYGGERDRLLRLCDVAHRMGIEERRTMLAEQLGVAVGQFVRSLLADLNLTADQVESARLAVPARLRALTAAVG